MRRVRLAFALLVPVLYACGGDSTSPPVPTTVVISPSTPTVTALGETTQFTAQVHDQDGNTIAGQSVTWSSVATGIATIDASSGVATAVARGSATIRASAGSATGTALLTVAPAPASLTKIAGDEQTGSVNSQLPIQPAVSVKDSLGNLLEGEQVTFQVITGEGTATPSTVLTDSNGEAATIWTLGNTSQVTHTLRATAGSISVDFTAQALPGGLSISTQSLNDGRATLAYSDSLVASGGSESGYTWSTVSGSLPPGISLGTAGGLTGTPTSAADFSFTVQVQDSEGATASRGLTLRVCEAPVSLSPGDVIALAPSGSDGCSFFLPSGSDGDRYRFAVIWPESDEEQVSPRIATVTTSAVAVSPTPVPAAAVSALERAPLELPADLMSAVRVANTTEAYHAELRARERRILRDMGGSLQLLPDRAETPTRSAPLLASAPDKKSFDVNFDGCDATSPGPVVTGVKIVEDDRFAVYQDSTVHATDPVSSQQVQEMLDYYRDYGESIITDYFDGIADVNEDDRVDVFITPIVEEGVAAFVWSGDFFDKSSCAQSNEAEVIYFAKSQIDNIGVGEVPNYQALPTLVHEMKHVSSLYKSIGRWSASGGVDPGYHPDWIEEGGAEIAGEMSSRKAWATLSGGPAVGEMANSQHKLDTGITKENYGIVMRWARTIYYMYSQPNGVVVTPTGAHASHSIYGSGWHFHRWLGDAYGNASTAYADTAFFKSQNDSLSTSGVAGILALTGKNWTQLMEEYVAAVMYNGTLAPQPTLAFTTHDFVSGLTQLLTSQPEGSYPYPVNLSGSAPTSAFSSGTYSGSIGASGIRVHDFTSNGTGVGMGVEVTMTGGRVVVVRLN